MTKEQAVNEYIDELECIKAYAERIYGSLVMTAGAIGYLPKGFEDWDERAPKGMLLTVAGAVNLLCKMLDELLDYTHEVIQVVAGAQTGTADKKAGTDK